MPAATRTLLLDNLTKLDKLSQSQRDEIVAALKAYAFSDAAGRQWRDKLVTAISAADFRAAADGAGALVMGTVTLKACP